MAVEVPAEVLQAFIDSGGEYEDTTPPATGATEQLVGDSQGEQEATATTPAASKPQARSTTAAIAATAQGAIDRVAAPAGRLHDTVAAAPTPGGVGMLVLALMLIGWAIVQFNGHTRLEWLWYTITGRARLRGRKRISTELQQWSDQSGPGDGGGGGGSGFGLQGDDTADAEGAYDDVDYAELDEVL